MRYNHVYIFYFILILYITGFMIDLIDPRIIGVSSASNLILFAGHSSVPEPPRLSFQMLMGTGPLGIYIFPALIGSLITDIPMALLSTAISLIMLYIFVHQYKNKIVKNIIDAASTSFLFLNIMIAVLIIYFAGPSTISISTGVGLSIWPLYLRRYKTPASLRYLLAMIFSGIGNSLAIIAFIFFSGIYTSYLNNVGNIMYMDSLSIRYAALGYWWVILFPLIFYSLFVISTNIVSNHMVNLNDPRGQ
ncbi:hypothetical protein [Picrophilus oshimae]|nr:hypothetical protein [Picrophilus oshimae]